MKSGMAEIEFRCLVVNVCNRLSTQDLRNIVYVQLYKRRHQFEDRDGLDIFDALECQGVFSPASPEGLLEIVENTGNIQVANIIKDYIEKRKRESGRPTGSPHTRDRDPPPLAQDAHLRTCYEVVRQQMKLLLKQIEVLKQAVWAGDQDEDGKLRGDQAVDNVGRTASELVERLRKARRQCGIPRSLSGSSTDSYSSESDATAAGAYRPGNDHTARACTCNSPTACRPIIYSCVLFNRAQSRSQNTPSD